MRVLIYAMIYLGSALMVYNIIRCVRFTRKARNMDGLISESTMLYGPPVLLILFLLGYLGVGLFTAPNILVAGILFGGSVFVYLAMVLLHYILDRVRLRESQMAGRYDELRSSLDYLTQDSLAVFRVDLTQDRIEARDGELYDSDRTAETFTALMEGRQPCLVLPSEPAGGLFRRQALLDHFSAGHQTAEERCFVRRPSGELCFVKLEASMAVQPSTGHVVAFITERRCNDEMVSETILHKTLAEEYELIVSLVGGQYAMVVGDAVEEREILSAPMRREGNYADCIRERILPLVAEEDRAETEEAMSLDRIRRELELAEPYRVELTYRPGGEKRYKAFSFYVVDRAADFYLMLKSDTTQVRKEELARNEALAAALAEARGASAAKTIFLSNMSHDIRTPMNAIVGYTGLAKREGVTPEQLRDYLDKIGSSSQHLLALINDVLEMSRIESGRMDLEPVETDLRELMDGIRDMFAAQMAGKTIAFAVNAEAVEDRYVLCDANRLNRVLLNLLSNACKFTPEGGRVSVVLSQTGRPEPGEGAYEIRVKDSGIGMSPEFAARVFDAFERERTSTVSGIQGTGLGMAITKRILDCMGGTIRLETAPGDGTEFIVALRFPLADRPGAAGEDRDAGGMNWTSMHLLLAEDNDLNREIALMVLEDLGFQMDTAVNGREAVDKVSAAPPGTYHAVLMDIQMPVMDGYSAARAIRQLEDPVRAGIPIIAMTANAFAEDIRQAEEAGMNGHIAKPLDLEKMRETLAEVLKR